MIIHKKMRLIALAIMLFAGLKATDLHAVIVEQPSLTSKHAIQVLNCCCLCHKADTSHYNPATCPCHQAPKKLTRKELAIRIALFTAGVALIPCAGFLGYCYARKIFIARMTQWIDDEINNAAHNGFVTPDIKKIIRFLYDTGCFVQNAINFMPTKSISFEKFLDHYAQSLEPF